MKLGRSVLVPGLLLMVGFEVAGGMTDSLEVAGDSLAAEPETVAVATRGILYLYGHRMEPPFSFVIERETVWVNGYQFIPPLQPGPPPPKLEVPEVVTREFNLSVRVGDELDRLRDEGVPYDSLLSRAVEMHRASDLVDSAKVKRGGLLIWWHSWRDRGWGPEHVGILRRKFKKRPHIEFLRDRTREQRNLLQDGAMLIWTAGPVLVVSPANVREREEQIRRIKERGWVTPEEERRLGPKIVPVLLNPRPLKRGDE
jgi:hypothetical protein